MKAVWQMKINRNGSVVLSHPSPGKTGKQEYRNFDSVEAANDYLGINFEAGHRLSQEEACHRKVRYGHQETAEQAVVRMAGKGIAGMSAYQCQKCSEWHVGHHGFNSK